MFVSNTKMSCTQSNRANSMGASLVRCYLLMNPPSPPLVSQLVQVITDQLCFILDRVAEVSGTLSPIHVGGSICWKNHVAPAPAPFELVLTVTWSIVIWSSLHIMTGCSRQLGILSVIYLMAPPTMDGVHHFRYLGMNQVLKYLGCHDSKKGGGMV